MPARSRRRCVRSGEQRRRSALEAGRRGRECGTETESVGDAPQRGQLCGRRGVGAHGGGGASLIGTRDLTLFTRSTRGLEQAPTPLRRAAAIQVATTPATMAATVDAAPALSHASDDDELPGNAAESALGEDEDDLFGEEGGEGDEDPA